MTDLIARNAAAYSPQRLSDGARANSRFVDWIWHIRGSVDLPAGQSADEAFDKLEPLFHKVGTSHERAHDTLTFRKKDQAAQDKMSIFDGGVLRIERGATGSVLRYRMASRALLFCFLAPLLFLSFAGLTIAVAKYQQPSAEEAKKDEKKDKDKDKVQPRHWIDQALGAPEPEKPKKDEKDKKADDKGPKPTSAYVFAAIFATLYVVGRFLEDRLVKSLFRKRLFGA